MSTDPVIRVTIKPSHRPTVLAGVSIEIETALGTIRIHDGRILRNKAEQFWFSLPTYSVTVGKTYEYKPSVELSAVLYQHVTVAALAAYERWIAPIAPNAGVRDAGR